MIFVNLKGGLGNQMFQYAIGRSLSLYHGTQLKLDIQFFKNRDMIPPNATFRKHELHIFNIVENFADEKELSLISNWKSYPYTNNEYIKKKLKYLRRFLGLYFIKSYSVLKDAELRTGTKKIIKLNQIPDNVYLDGIWANINYFEKYEDILRKDFTFKNDIPKDLQKVKSQILEKNSVSVNVRRGDYLTNQTANKIFGVIGKEYYFRAIDFLKKKIENPVFYFFSDDIEWCKRNFSDIAEEVYFIPNNYEKRKFELDIHLVSLCKHNIISNSTFTWWGAWLNDNPRKIVIYPFKWFKDKNWQKNFIQNKPIIYDDWIGL